MSSGAVSLALAVAFIVHNLEEWSGYDRLVQMFPGTIDERLRDRTVFGYGLVFLSVTVVTVAALQWFDATQLASLFGLVIALALFFNALWHCAASLLWCEVLPGTVSALLLILPLSSFEIWVACRDQGSSLLVVILQGVLALILLPIMILTSLWLGYAIKRTVERLSAKYR